MGKKSDVLKLEMLLDGRMLATHKTLAAVPTTSKPYSAVLLETAHPKQTYEEGRGFCVCFAFYIWLILCAFVYVCWAWGYCRLWKPEDKSWEVVLSPGWCSLGRTSSHQAWQQVPLPLCNLSLEEGARTEPAERTSIKLTRQQLRLRCL